MADAIRIEGMDKLAKKIAGLTKLKHTKTAVRAAGEHVEGKVAKYPAEKRPSRKSVYGSTFVSDRQRKFFFAALKDGDIDVPYRRGQSGSSEKHGRRWATKVTNRGFRATIGNNSSYGPLLQDEDEQSQYHKDVGWNTIQEVKKDETPTVIKIINQGIRRDVNG